MIFQLKDRVLSSSLFLGIEKKAMCFQIYLLTNHVHGGQTLW
jgi:hypothetical protein